MVFLHWFWLHLKEKLQEDFPETAWKKRKAFLWSIKGALSRYSVNLCRFFADENGGKETRGRGAGQRGEGLCRTFFLHHFRASGSIDVAVSVSYPCKVIPLSDEHSDSLWHPLHTKEGDEISLGALSSELNFNTFFQLFLRYFFAMQLALVSMITITTALSLSVFSLQRTRLLRTCGKLWRTRGELLLYFEMQRQLDLWSFSWSSGRSREAPKWA